MTAAGARVEAAEPADAPTRLVLVRHGETEWSKAGRHTGRTDVPLTDVGRQQARRVGQALAGRTFSRVEVSPMSRARETARLAGFGDRMETLDDLREYDYGIYEGRTRADILREVPGWSVWTRPMLEGESLAALATRADRVIATLLPLGGDVLVFSHGHFLRELATRWIEAAPPEASRLELWTATISELGWEHDNRVIEVWNSGPAGA